MLKHLKQKLGDLTGTLAPMFGADMAPERCR